MKSTQISFNRSFVLGVLFVLVCFFSQCTFSQTMVLQGVADNSSSSVTGKTVANIASAESTNSADAKDTTDQRVNRLTDRISQGCFTLEGRGEKASWGFGRVVNFKYRADVCATSKIESKTKRPDGSWEVIELREFKTATDSLVVYDSDIVLRPDTLPVDELLWLTTIITICNDPLKELGIPGLPYIVRKTTKELDDFLRKTKKWDGTSIGKVPWWEILKNFGYSPEKLPTFDSSSISSDEAVKKILEQLIKKMSRLGTGFVYKTLGGVRDVMGNQYRIVWRIKNGKASQRSILRLNKDSKQWEEIVGEEELLILRRVNVFIDSSVYPDESAEVGSQWVVLANEIGEVFDPFVDGDYAGFLMLQRDKDDTNGNMCLSLAEKSTVRVVNSSGTTTGTLMADEGGKATINKNSKLIDSFNVTGRTNLKSVTTHHWLFRTRLEGDVKFVGNYSEEALSKTDELPKK